MTIPQKLQELNERAGKLFEQDGQIRSITYEVKNWPLQELMEYAGRFDDRLDIVTIGGHKHMQLLAQSSIDTLINVTVFFYSVPIIVTNPRVIEELKFKK